MRWMRAFNERDRTRERWDDESEATRDDLLPRYYEIQNTP